MTLKMGKATRDAFGEALAELGGQNKKIVVLDGDVGNSTRTEWFAEKHPELYDREATARRAHQRAQQAATHQSAAAVHPHSNQSRGRGMG